MRKIHYFFIFSIFLISIIGAEAVIFPLFTNIGIEQYLASKLAYLTAYALLILLFFALRNSKEFSINFSISSAKKLAKLAGFGFCFSFLDYSLVGLQVLLVAQFSNSYAASLWEFSPSLLSWGADNHYLGLNSGFLSLALFLCTQIVGAPLVEELYFRGLVFNKLRQRSSLAISILGTSVLFTLFHPVNQYLSTFIFSVLLTKIFSGNQNILEVTFIHGVNNLCLWLESGFGAMSHLKNHDPATLSSISAWYPELLTAAILIPTSLMFLNWLAADLPQTRHFNQKT